MQSSSSWHVAWSRAFRTCRAHILAQEAMRRVHYDSCVPFTVDDLSPRSARCLAELTRTRDSHH
jgi:hypothetical protein